jgi:cell division septation protein DedD
MSDTKHVLLIFLFFALLFPATAQDNSGKFAIPDSVQGKVSQEETILYNMINDMRRKNKLSLIPFSVSLSSVARIHIGDLILSRPQDQGCSLHSWSASGSWTSCCNTKGTSGIQCMKLKPREITGYPGNGYELIYWGEDKATPADAAALWQEVGASSDMILSRGKWKGYQWKAMGVGIKDGYAVLWLGDKTDNRKTENLVLNKPAVLPATEKVPLADKPAPKEPTNLVTESPVNQKALPESGPTGTQLAGEQEILYYLIVASVKSAASARTELKRIQAAGYHDAFILQGDSVYRVAVASYNSTRMAALKARELKGTFPGIWVYKK